MKTVTFHFCKVCNKNKQQCALIKKVSKSAVTLKPDSNETSTKFVQSFSLLLYIPLKQKNFVLVVSCGQRVIFQHQTPPPDTQLRIICRAYHVLTGQRETLQTVQVNKASSSIGLASAESVLRLLHTKKGKQRHKVCAIMRML